MNRKFALLLSLAIVSLTSQARGSRDRSGPMDTGCVEIPQVGSPVLMIPNVHEYIEGALDADNPYTQVKYIFFSRTASKSTAGKHTYKIVFSINDYHGTKYVGLELFVSPFTMGNSRITRMLITRNIDLIKEIIDPEVDPSNSYTCGDLKMIYTRSTRAPSAQMKEAHSRRSLGLSMLAKAGKTDEMASVTRRCVSANYIETNEFFGTTSNNTPIDLVHCLPRKEPINAIMVGCHNNALAGLQLVYNNIDNKGTKMSLYVGDSQIPASSITTIPLGDADRISFTAYTSPNSLRIQTLDQINTVISSFTCGTGESSPKNVIVGAEDFLGFSAIHTNGDIIQSFQVATYRAQY